jgi:hypothetical protein
MADLQSLPYRPGRTQIRGKLHNNHAPGELVRMSDRDYIIAADGSYRILSAVSEHAFPVRVTVEPA